MQCLALRGPGGGGSGPRGRAIKAHHLSFDSERFESTDASQHVVMIQCHHAVSSTCMSFCPLGWHARPLTRLVRNDSIIGRVLQVTASVAKQKQLYAPQTKIVEGRTNLSECVFEVLFNVTWPKSSTHTLEKGFPGETSSERFVRPFTIFVWEQPSATHPLFDKPAFSRFSQKGEPRFVVEIIGKIVKRQVCQTGG